MLRFSIITAAVSLAVFAGPALAESADGVNDSPVSTIRAEGGTADSAGGISDSTAAANGGAAAQAADTRGAADGPSAQAAGKRAAAGDSTAEAGGQAAADNSLAAVVNRRAAAYGVAAVDSAMSFDPSRADAAVIFRSDAVSGAEILRYRSSASVSIPFSLSSSLNRLLPYGYAAPVGYAASPASAAARPSCYAPRYHSGDVSNAQASDVTLVSGSGFVWTPYPDALTAPELLIFWENGVFNQNTLSLRLSRPLSPNLMLSAFSNYRYFKGTGFDHEGNDIASFYEAFNPDTSAIMNRGYNPLTDEHALGAALSRFGADSSKLYASFTYGSLQNEYALKDSAATSLDSLKWALLDRQSYRIDAAALNKKLWLMDVNVKTAFVAERVTLPDTANANANANSNANAAVSAAGGTGSFIGAADAALPFGLGAAFSGLVKNMDFFNGAKKTYLQGDPEIFYKQGFGLGFADADIDLRAGIALLPWDDTLHTSLWAKAAAALSLGGNAKLNLYAALDGITVYPDYDTDYNPGDTGASHIDAIDYDMYRPGIDRFVEIGADGTILLGYFGAMLGYRLTAGIDSSTVKASWPEGVPPYAQPNHTIIISPWMSRVNGFSLLSKTFITDTKPYIKTSAALSYVIQPGGMAHTFETELGFDYWSERDPVTFAGIQGWGWHAPIYDLNLKITAHIKTFRLFWKAGNLLNMRQAYVPGYFSPGLTFRWGINWFLL